MSLLRNLKRDKVFWLYFLIISLGIGCLNNYSSLMHNLLGYYLDYVAIIKGGFDPDQASLGRPTFPMWGYGWVFLLTTERLIIVVLQMFLAAIAVLVSLNYLYENNSFSNRSIKILKILILLSFSWIAIHFTLTPYSIAISLQIISLIYLLRSLEDRPLMDKILNIAVSAICFGLLLNFRSDYIYFIIVVGLLFLWGNGRKEGLRMFTFWILILGFLLSPWAIYTNKVVGEPLLTSTNSGHVFYIGLGHLPENKWGITTYDADPRMYSELRNAMPKEEANSLRYEGDKWLKKRFLELVIADPMEYSKKVLYSAAETLVSGIYVPEFHNVKLICDGNCKEKFIDDITNTPISSLFLSKEKFFVYGVSYLSIFIGVVILLSSYLILPYVMFDSIKKKNIFIFSCCLILLYQLAINSLAFQMKLYSTNAYFFSLILLSYMGDKTFLKSRYSRDKY